MITGRVENRQALVAITYRLPDQPDLMIEHVVDTGFTGMLTLPVSAVAAMGLTFDRQERIRLANDGSDQVAFHFATIMWEGQEFVADVIATGTRPLFGTALMDRKELVIQFSDSGLVTIDAL